MHTNFRKSIIGACAYTCLFVSGSSYAEIRVFPDAIALDGARDAHSVLVQFVDDDGVTRDITSIADFAMEDQNLASFEDGVLRPLADGSSKLRVRFATFKASIPVAVSNASSRRPVSFKLDVMPVFMRAGCNTGSCHGSARGQDGFRLSLFGYDPDGDYHRLTRELVGRRVNVAAPEKSLVLEKATGVVTHTGGDLFDADSQYYKSLHEWISAGAPEDSDEVAKVEGIELFPEKMVLKESAEKAPTQQLLVRAKYSDGTTRDVTPLAVFLTNNESTAAVDDFGVATARAAGGAFVFARFDKFTIGSEMIVLPDAEFEWSEPEAHNFVDELVYDKLQKLQLLPSGIASDEAFLRRAHLDIAGLPPTTAEYYAFLENTDPDKRSRLIDDLLSRDEFVDLWAMKWGEMLQVKAGNDVRGGRPRKAAWKYYAWLREQIAANRPVDEMVAELIAAKGSNIAQPTANFYTTSSNRQLTPLQRGENIAQLFLGTRIQCAQCHNHPFDRWTQDDYYGFVSFFAGVSSKTGANALELYIYNNNGKNTVEHPVDGRQVKPKFLGGEAPDVDGKDPRAALAKWMTSSDNRVFAQNLANRAWAHFFGRGIVEPVDDMRITNPPSNKELLEALGDKLIAYDFDMRKLIRDIVSSRTYQLSSTATASNGRDDRFFSRAYVRRLQAEVLLDTLSASTDTVSRFSRMPTEFRAAQLFQGAPRGDYFLETFGAARRETVCACEVSKEANLAQALHLINGSTLNEKLRTSRVVQNLVESSAPPEEIIEQLYVRALARKPSASELERMLSLIGEDANHADSKMRRAAYDDLFWSLLNSTEFAFNH